jgi:hypothetical protein
LEGAGKEEAYMKSRSHDSLKDDLKRYFETVNATRPLPDLPPELLEENSRSGSRHRGETLFLAACALAALLCILQPGLYDNSLRELSVSQYRVEEFRSRSNRLVFDAIQQYKSMKGHPALSE